jgi:hypothetical protein
MDAYTLTGTRTKTHWRRGLALAWWAIVAIPASALAERPVLHPGTERYRDSAPPSISRMGGATLMARALLGKGGETTVEVSTSTLDTATLARGSISKLQIKLLDNQGRVRGTENHMGLSSRRRDLQLPVEQQPPLPVTAALLQQLVVKQVAIGCGGPVVVLGGQEQQFADHLLSPVRCLGGLQVALRRCALQDLRWRVQFEKGRQHLGARIGEVPGQSAGDQPQAVVEQRQ